MNSRASHQGGWLIVASFALAYVLTLVPLPEVLERARPEWVALVLIYWCMAVPERVGVGTGWVAGLIQDAIQSTLLGQHALTYALLAYLTLKLHQRIRVYPVWQQAISVMVLLLLAQTILLWVNGVIGRPSLGWEGWLTALTGTLLWPVLFVSMREFRRNFNVR
jgi:rod shape-determining protein MreD